MSHCVAVMRCILLAALRHCAVAQLSPLQQDDACVDQACALSALQRSGSHHFGGHEIPTPILENGDFELGSTITDFNASQDYRNIVGWTTCLEELSGGNTAYWYTNNSPTQSAKGLKANSGSYFLSLEFFQFEGGLIEQDVQGHLPGKWYVLTFYTVISENVRLVVSIDRKPRAKFYYNGHNGWTQQKVFYQAYGNSVNLVIAIKSNSNGGCGVATEQLQQFYDVFAFVDDVTIQGASPAAVSWPQDDHEDWKLSQDQGEVIRMEERAHEPVLVDGSFEHGRVYGLRCDFINTYFQTQIYGWSECATGARSYKQGFPQQFGVAPWIAAPLLADSGSFYVSLNVYGNDTVASLRQTVGNHKAGHTYVFDFVSAYWNRPTVFGTREIQTSGAASALLTVAVDDVVLDTYNLLDLLESRVIPKWTKRSVPYRASSDRVNIAVIFEATASVTDLFDVACFIDSALIRKPHPPSRHS